MRATTHTPVEELETDDEHETPWWADRAVLIPIASGVAFVAGLACEWSGAQSAALVLFWVGLLLGASTFVPGALRKLATGKLGIALLMTMSATGAVILGHVEEAAALAFLYSIAEALEDRAMDRARAGLRALLEAGLIQERTDQTRSRGRGRPRRSRRGAAACGGPRRCGPRTGRRARRGRRRRASWSASRTGCP